MEKRKISSKNKLDINDNLELSSISLPKIIKNITVPDEVNDYLRAQLQQAKQENENLKKHLYEHEIETQEQQAQISNLSAKLKEYEGACGNSRDFISSTQFASGKIVSLTKKLRERNSEVEVYKTKCSKLEATLADLKESETIASTPQVEEKKIDDPGEIKKLQEKLAIVQNKWSEEKNTSAQLKNNLKLANKWLQQEIGDKFETLLAINGSTSSWRGRAQVICDLQQKNSDLKDRLKLYQEGRSSDSLTPAKNDKKLEALTQENCELRTNLEDIKRKFEAIKSRNKALEKEYNITRIRMAAMSEKAEHDQEVINSLNSEMSCRTDRKSDELKQNEQLIKKLQQENELYKIELAKERCASENKSKELENKNNDINVLNKRIRSSRPPSSYSQKPENAESKVLGRLEVERLRLLELTEIQNRRLDEERTLHLKTQNALKMERQKAARLEANLARVELDHNSSRTNSYLTLSTQRTNFSNKCNSSNHDQAMQDQLELAKENVKALSTRLELEVMERKSDLREFAKILNNYAANR